jgi:hypothetical protein
MIDFKNLLLAWMSSGMTIVAAIADGNMLYIVSAIILPIIFFTVGKTIDVVLQLYLRRNIPGGNSAVTPEIDKRDKLDNPPVSARKLRKQ